jgi:hypothetical protein
MVFKHPSANPSEGSHSTYANYRALRSTCFLRVLTRSSDDTCLVMSDSRYVKPSFKAGNE